MTLLRIKSLNIFSGDLKTVDNFQISIGKEQFYGLIGPNGTSEATVFNLLIGVYKSDAGSIKLAGVSIASKKIAEINQAGITRVFQNIRLFKDLSVLDDVKAGLHSHYRYFATIGIFRFPNYFKVEKQMDEKTIEPFKVFGLDEECDYKASNPPYGEQRKLETARTLATEPKLLLPDEPAVRMNLNKTAEPMDTIRFVRDNFDTTILLIEHDMKFVSGICEELTAPNFGQVLCQGEIGAVLHNPEVVKAYLGE